MGQSANSIESEEKNPHVLLSGLSLGTLIQLQFEGLGSSRSILLGMDPGKFLIIQTPAMSDIWSMLFQKNNAIVRYLSSGRVYAFRCTLLAIIKEPCRFSILSYPESVEEINLRKFERISCIIEAEIQIRENTYTGIMTDISLGGCSFDFNKPENTTFPEIQIQEEVSIAIQMKEKGRLKSICAIIRSIKKDRNNLIIGLQFVPWDEDSQEEKSEQALNEYVRSVMETL
jgi:hypothetical protein